MRRIARSIGSGSAGHKQKAEPASGRGRRRAGGTALPRLRRRGYASAAEVAEVWLSVGSGFCSGKWQAASARCPPNGRSGGSTSAQISSASGQRVRNRQPDGGWIALGSSPVMPALTLACSASGSATGAESSRPLVYGWAGPQVHLVGGADLDQLAQVHDADLAGQVADHGQVVGDEQVGQAELPLQVAHHVEDLGLDRHVERGDRLVGDDQLRVEHQRAGEAEPLALAAGELVRVPLGRTSAGSPTWSSISATFWRLLVRETRCAARSSGSRQDRAGPHPRVERRVGVLEHQLDVLALPAVLPAAAPGQVLAVEVDRPAGRLVQADHAACRSWSCRSRTRRPCRASRRPADRRTTRRPRR